MDDYSLAHHKRTQRLNTDWAFQQLLKQMKHLLVNLDKVQIIRNKSGVTFNPVGSTSIAPFLSRA